MSGLEPRQLDALRALDIGEISADAPLAALNRLGLAARADALAVVRDRSALDRLARWARRERLALTPLEHGTDRLLREGGLRGLSLLLGAGFATAERRGDRLHLGGACTLATARSLDLPLPGWLACEPDERTVASVVGALAAGAATTSPPSDVEVVLGRGVIEHSLPSPDRPRLGLRDEAVCLGLAVPILADRGDPPSAPPGVRLLLDPARGSSAADLVRRSGLAGVRVRGARLLESTPERVVVEGEGSARDVEALLRWVQQRVATDWGVELESALRIAGDMHRP